MDKNDVTKAVEFVKDETMTYTGCMDDEDAQRYAEGFVTGLLVYKAAAFRTTEMPTEEAWRGWLRAAINWERSL